MKVLQAQEEQLIKTQILGGVGAPVGKCRLVKKACVPS